MCICSIRTSHQESLAFISGSVYEVKQHVSQWLRENRSVLVCESQNSQACFQEDKVNWEFQSEKDSSGSCAMQ